MISKQYFLIIVLSVFSVMLCAEVQAANSQCTYIMSLPKGEARFISFNSNAELLKPLEYNEDTTVSSIVKFRDLRFDSFEDETDSRVQPTYGELYFGSEFALRAQGVSLTKIFEQGGYLYATVSPFAEGFYHVLQSGSEEAFGGTDYALLAGKYVTKRQQFQTNTELFTINELVKDSNGSATSFSGSLDLVMDNARVYNKSSKLEGMRLPFPEKTQDRFNEIAKHPPFFELNKEEREDLDKLSFKLDSLRMYCTFDNVSIENF